MPLDVVQFVQSVTIHEIHGKNIIYSINNKLTDTYLLAMFLYEAKVLFCLGLSFPSGIFHSYEDVTITGEGLQILTYARHSRT